MPRVIAAQDAESYYKILMELVSLLKDSHTAVIPPWGRFVPGYDIPPVELHVIHDRFYVARISETDEIVNQRIYPGLEIIEVENNIPAGEYFENNVLKYYTRGTKQGDEAVLPFYLLYGPQNEKVMFKVRDIDGSMREVALTRNSMNKDGEPFFYKFVESLMTNTIKTELLDNAVLYVSIPNFQNGNTRIYKDFEALIDTLDTNNVAGLILDVRLNLGGNRSYADKITACLIDETVSTPVNNYFSYTPAHIPVGKVPIEWTSRHWDIQPRNGKRYLGPVVILTGSATHSSGEDFVIELSQSGHVITVGEKTSGGAGGKLPFALPGGGCFELGTFTATFPDGREYVGIGIEPDIEVTPTREDLIDVRDRTLEKGIEVIKNWGKYIDQTQNLRVSTTSKP